MQPAEGWPSNWMGRHSPAYRPNLGADLGGELGSDAASRLEGEAEASAAHATWPESYALGPTLAEARPSNRRLDPPGIRLRGVGPADTLAALIHDARNMVAAMDLYCDLLEEPGVLSPAFGHYAAELRLVGGASRRLLERLAVAEYQTELEHAPEALKPFSLQGPPTPSPGSLPKSPMESSAAGSGSFAPTPERAFGPQAVARAERAERQSADPCRLRVENLAAELRANQSLLTALVGPAVTVGFSIRGGSHPVAMAAEDLTRVLVNLARNAAQAMPCGGHLQIALEEGRESLSLSFADTGCGIPEALVETIFSPGYTSYVRVEPRAGAGANSAREANAGPDSSAWPIQHRGLGLSIVRSIVTAAGGVVWAANQAREPALADWTAALGGPGEDAPMAELAEMDWNRPETPQGAIITIEFPLPAAWRVT